MSKSPKEKSSRRIAANDPRDKGWRAAITLILWWYNNTREIGNSRSPFGLAKSIKRRWCIPISVVGTRQCVIIIRPSARARDIGRTLCQVTTTTMTWPGPWVRYSVMWVRNIMYRSQRRWWRKPHPRRPDVMPRRALTHALVIYIKMYSRIHERCDEIIINIHARTNRMSGGEGCLSKPERGRKIEYKP